MPEIRRAEPRPLPDEVGALSDIRAYLDSLRAAQSGEVNKAWVEFRRTRVSMFGENAIASLIPEKVKVDTNPLTHALNTLAREGVTTFEDIVAVDFDSPKYRYLRSFGPASRALGKLLQNAALVKLELQKSEAEMGQYTHAMSMENHPAFKPD